MLAEALYNVDEAQFLSCAPAQGIVRVQTSEVILTPGEHIFLLHAPGCTAVNIHTVYVLESEMLRGNIVFSSYTVNR